MCFNDNFVFGERDRNRRNRREIFICECREVDRRRDDRHHGCHGRRRRNDFVCRCREV